MCLPTKIAFGSRIGEEEDHDKCVGNAPRRSSDVSHQYHEIGMVIMASRDMANVSVGWEIDGNISPQESVSGMINVITTKDMRHTGTFWTWEGNVGCLVPLLAAFVTNSRKVHPW